MAAGMNWGIMSLLGMIVLVLGGVAGFFIFLARRSAALTTSNGALGMKAEAGTHAEMQSNDAEDWQSQPLADRAGLRRVSALAQLRSRCAHPQSEAKRLTAPRKRS